MDDMPAPIGSHVQDRDPLVSVIIPVYNGEQYLAEALDSVFAQEYRPLEVIVVNDGSTDGSADLARSYAGVRYLEQVNQGPAAARNRGIAASAGEFIAFLDHDDVWAPNKLSIEVALLRSNPHLGCVMSRAELFLEGLQEWPKWVALGLEGLGKVTHIQSALVVRRDVFHHVGFLDATYRVAEDTEWLLRASDAGVEITYMARVLMRRRIHSGNLSYRQDLARYFAIRAVHGSIQRKRQRDARAEVPE
jgi:glycosyltransferase involved in cell wall biosynthesis